MARLSAARGRTARLVMTALAALAAAGMLHAAPPEVPLGAEAVAVEAEDGLFFGVREESELSGFEGTGYVRFPPYDPTSLDLDFEVGRDGDYCLRLRAVVVPGDDDLAQVRIDVDDGYLVAQRLPVAGVFGDVLANRPLRLSKGAHRISVASLRGEWSLDKAYLEPLTEKLLAAVSPGPGLVAPGASAEARAVYAYLLGMEGKGILSGQQIYAQTPEIDAIFGVTGKYPAILGVDFIDASPSRVERGTRSFAASEAIKYWKKGGIVAACWHWNAPAGLVDKEPDRRWHSGFYAKATTFDFAAALDHPEGADYALILRDIDAIAAELKKLQAAGVSVLWRPLHEAAGGWFWWGARGPEPYLKLYKLLFERLTFTHGLHNLIWVWNGQDPEWYPGDDYADIVSIDIYPPKHEHETQLDKFAETQACSFKAKLVALSENGSLPNILKIAEHKIPWSWYCTWNGEFAVDGRTKRYSGEYSDASLLKNYYDDPWLVTRDELPAFFAKP
jgi:mannan endo-1,4-beta-mannosidase